MKAIRLTLISHGMTRAQKLGQLHQADDSILPLEGLPPVLLPDVQVLTAPERRAVETAAWFSPQAKVELALADCDLGLWKGLTLKQLQQERPAEIDAWIRDPFSAPHGGESFAQLRQRMAGWLEAFTLQGDWMVFTHPLVMRAVLMNVLGCSPAAADRIDIMPLSRLHLSFSGHWRLRLT
ncbi:histidine phosphatase family protein [Pseudomonas putida]|uniref:Histidine phosphatase family protein n=1 Tax=Pseudomonas putida TaxID=303 RepID=A0A6I6XJY2_PSEPU|nr:histidine phosphatase family protein [Pseudomonas putida]QHG64137.1 histidine phosphatase family protein [Pseudomonas putida]